MSVSLISTVAAKNLQNESGNGNGNKSSHDKAGKITALPHSANEMNVTVTPIKSQSIKAELPEPEVSRVYAQKRAATLKQRRTHCEIGPEIFLIFFSN